MAPTERTLALCDLLLGAAHADAHFSERERATVRELLADLHGEGGLPAEVEERIAGFDPSSFAVDRAAAPFAGDSLDEKRKLLYLVAAVHEADEELDLAEDDYLRALALALEVPQSELASLTIDVEVEELKEQFEAVRKGPPPVPGART
ncbi:MAG TPA: TerB family tellurite resistance protein [Kofleriaceae bacterium]|nr:TerB family tellurite resistance protein [Kofleriaceae bacterium]